MAIAPVAGGDVILASYSNSILTLLQDLSTGHTHNETDSRKLATLNTTTGHDHNGTNSKILANSSVGSDQIATSAVIEAKVGTGAITADKIGTGAVVEGKIGTGAVVEAKIGTGAVTADKIGTGAVTEIKVNYPRWKVNYAAATLSGDWTIPTTGTKQLRFRGYGLASFYNGATPASFYVRGYMLDHSTPEIIYEEDTLGSFGGTQTGAAWGYFQFDIDFESYKGSYTFIDTVGDVRQGIIWNITDTMTKITFNAKNLIIEELTAFTV